MIQWCVPMRSRPLVKTLGIGRDGETVGDTETQAIMWIYDDGGRARAGYRGNAPGDCATRAAAIASGRPYQEIYDRIINLARLERPGTTRERSHPREGVTKRTMQRLMEELGATWTPTMAIGTGCTTHVAMHELPMGRLVLSLSRHYTACIDQVLYDLYDPSRQGTRCCYGVWELPEPD